MEVATTNNHSQSHHHHHLQAAQSHGNGGAGGSGSRSPFQREVREWQRIDPNTGALFSGRLEADRWINGPLNSYGKISDSQNISQPNGTQHTQRKQLEVLKARTANGAMQVIRTQTVQKTSSTTSSTSRGWATSSTSTTTRTSNGLHGSSDSASASTSNTLLDPIPPAIWAAPTRCRPKPRIRPMPMTMPMPMPMPSSQSVDICELSDDDSSLSGSLSSDVGIVSPAMSTLRKLSNGQEHIDDHVDFVVINGEASDQDADVAHLHKLGHNLLPDTAPSLKLSNLMKSSSSISSQSSNNSNLTTATAAATATAGNTHRSAGKISLHAIVGPESSSSSSSTTTSTSSAWAKQQQQQQQQQQADLYGQPAASSRVGVSQLQPGTGTGTGTGSDADVAVVAGSTPTRLRRDLESFRHYNDDAANDDDLRLSARHQRRQQVSQSVYAPPLPAIGTGLLQRSRSISTDDLSQDWERNAEEQDEQEPGEWRRVSKLRRSFQSQDHYKAAIARPRPLDLPSNSVSVARMRAELENGRRLNTAMRNNHVDLAALDTILNIQTAAAKPTAAKRNTFLTAESLQEIRGRLKKLSDESLYKEDFLAYHQAPRPPTLREQSEVVQVAVQVQAAPLPALPSSAFRPVHNTHSLESRSQRSQKDTSSSEWHLRRKSYGFEKMSPPEDKSIFRVDASTDSGLGRSGEQLGNWSPTERERERERNAAAAAQLNNVGGTIIHFGRRAKPPASPAHEGELSKRHSIAVEETWRDIRKTSQVHVNGGTGAVTSSSSSSTTNSSSHLQRGSAQKRVEFCKTEVHFAAESGRVNIVETDGKPPPTNNFRRRRRSSTASGPLQSLVKSASAAGSATSSSSSNNDNVTHFGDDPQRRKTIASSTVAYRATLMDSPELVSQPTSTSIATASSTATAASTMSQVTVTTLAKAVELEPRYSLTESTSRNSYTSTSGVDTTDNETDELSNIRGILKNKPVKPKPYHLGENIESADVLWSVPAMKGERGGESPSGRDSGITSDSPICAKSVAERIRIVEQRQQKQKQPSPAGNGYSTKINVSLGAEEWPESDLPKSNVMNIALHSPRVEKPKATPPTLRIGQLIPVARPRTLFIQPTSVEAPDESGSESLKIVKEARGARKLREHELSYFGVQQQQQQQQQQQTKLSTTSTNPRRTLPTRSKLSHTEETAPTTTTTKWQLLNDRPDLLRHSPQDNDYDDDDDNDDADADDDDNEEHCYENIANELTTTFRVKSPSSSRSRSPGNYERKTDLQRDAQILSEMTRNADQTLKALSDEAAIKDQRRRSCSLQRRSGKPLETIDEKVNKVCNGERQSLSVARGTFASEARRNSRQSTPSPTPTRARSSSQSSIECCPRDRSRSSSRESNTQGAGSSDDQATKHRAERLRMRTPKREKSRHEPSEQRTSRHTSKPRSSTTHAAAVASAATSSLESKRSSHHSRHREVEHSSESKHGSGIRLLRSSRVSDESRPRQSALRERERERERDRDRERSRGSEKHREELTRSRGHSSRSRHSSEQAAQAAGTRESGRPSKTRSSRSSHEAATAHKKSTTAATAKSSKSTTHKATANHSTATTTTNSNSTAPTPSTHNELTHGKSTLNGHHHQHQQSSNSKHHGSAAHGHRDQPHHVHSLTTTTIAASRHQRERHGKDRK